MKKPNRSRELRQQRNARKRREQAQTRRRTRARVDGTIANLRAIARHGRRPGLEAETRRQLSRLVPRERALALYIATGRQMPASMVMPAILAASVTPGAGMAPAS